MNKNYSPQTDWLSREKRELFCKAVNSMMMTSKSIDAKDLLVIAKMIVDTAFSNYPDRAEEQDKKDIENFELNVVQQDEGNDITTGTCEGK